VGGDSEGSRFSVLGSRFLVLGSWFWFWFEGSPGSLVRGSGVPGSSVHEMSPEAQPESASQRLERAVGIVLRAGVTVSSVCLGVGVVWALAAGESGGARVLLQTGILVLLLTPVARVVVSIAQYAADRDWPFATLTTIVLAELLASAVAALLFNKKL